MGNGASKLNSTERHPSVVALLAEHPSEVDPKGIIRRLAEEKAITAISRGWEGPPFCPKILASSFGIRCFEVDHDIDSDGRILLKRGKLIIEYAKGRLKERQRFTMFHEFAHTLFPDFCKYLPLHAGRAVTDPEREFENLCDIGASEFLFPKQYFISDIRDVARLTFEAIHDLRTRYQASIDATVYKSIEFSGDSYAAVFFTDTKGHHSGGGPLWVRNFARTTSSRLFIAPGTTPPQTSVVRQCYSAKLERTPVVEEQWSIDGRLKKFLVQAASLPGVPQDPKYPKVVALMQQV
jgi:Zn-dependent peptidase ImmA (M78 family)